MTTERTLHDRLTDLANEAPAGGPVPGLWDRGRQVARRRRAGTAAIAVTAVVLLAVVTGVHWHRAAAVPAPSRGPVGVPDQVWTPSAWLPTTDQPGQLVAMSSADRGTWTGAHPALVSISATTGEYAFLDLPGADLDAGGVQLAPDGHHIAYWLSGKTTGTPTSDSGPITGLAVYDTQSGAVTRHWIPTRHGLFPEFLAWADASTVVFSAGQIRGGDDASDMDQSSSTFGTVTAWSLGGQPRPVAGVEPGADLEGVGHGRMLLGTFSSRPGREHLLVDVTGQDRARYIEVPALSGSTGFLHFVALDQTGTRIALVPGNESPNPVKSGIVGNLQAVPDTDETLGVVDWTDDETIVTLAFDGGWENQALFRVSTATGTSQRLVRFPADTGVGDWQFATDLLGAPSVAASKPPEPLDPRVTLALSSGVCVLAAAAVLLWRRRVRV